MGQNNTTTFVTLNTSNYANKDQDNANARGPIKEGCTVWDSLTEGRVHQTIYLIRKYIIGSSNFMLPFHIFSPLFPAWREMENNAN